MFYNLYHKKTPNVPLIYKTMPSLKGFFLNLLWVRNGEEESETHNEEKRRRSKNEGLPEIHGDPVTRPTL